MWVAFANANISLYAIFNDQSFNKKSINWNIVTFEQLGPGVRTYWEDLFFEF